MTPRAPHLSDDFIKYMCTLAVIAVLSFITFVILLNLTVRFVTMLRAKQQLPSGTSEDGRIYTAGDYDEKRSLMVKEVEVQAATKDHLSGCQREESPLPPYRD